MKRVTPTLCVVALLYLGRVEAYVGMPPSRRTQPFIDDPLKTPSHRQRTSNGRKHAVEPLMNQKVGWHRRVFKRVFKRSKKGDKSLLMQASASSEKTAGLTSSNFDGRDIFLHAFDVGEPLQIIPLEQTELQLDNGPRISIEIPVDSLPDDSVLDKSHEDLNKDFENAGTDAGRTHHGKLRPSAILRLGFENFLSSLLDKWSTGENVDMNIKCEPTSSLGALLIRGFLRCDVSVDFDSCIFNTIQMSSGRLEAQGMAVNLWSFAKGKVPGAGSLHRYPEQFDFVAQDVTFTQEDLFKSACIRNGLRRLLTRVLKKRVGLGFEWVKIDSIQVLPSGKLSCRGEAVSSFGSAIPFEVRSGLGVTSRGHILTFPGLEISLSPDFGLFVPMLFDVSVDLGHNAKILDIKLDGESSEVHLSARVTVTPEHTIRLRNYVQSSDAFGALCSVDVGRWLTRVGRFTH